MLIKKIEDKYSVMTKSHKRIAKYIIDNYSDVLFCTLAELSEKIGTSTTTIIRFSQFIGYNGFSEMQRNVQTQVMQNGDSAHEPSKELKQYQEEAFQKIEAMFSQLDEAYIDTICRQLLEAKRVLIIGYKDSFGTAAELLHRLDTIRENVYFSRLIHDWNDLLNLMKEDTLVLIVSFSPHYAYTLDCAETAASRDCKVLTISDNPINPFTELSDYTVTIPLATNKSARFPEVYMASVFIDYLFYRMTVVCGKELIEKQADKASYLQ